MKLEIGMYVRTKDGYIGKLVDIDEDHHYINGAYNYSYRTQAYKIKVFSRNLIDLIEVGDIITTNNTEQTARVYFEYFLREEKGNLMVDLEFFKKEKLKNLFKRGDVSSILTKEQYNQNCYKVSDPN